MSSLHESYAVTIKLNAAQHEWLATTARAMTDLNGNNVTHGAVIMRLMELGAPILGQSLALQKAQAESTRKSTPRLKIIRNDHST